MSNKKANYLNLAVSKDEENRTATLDIYGVIGYDWEKGEEEQNTKNNIKKVLDDIRSLDVDTIYVNISSIGGLVDDGLVIYDLLAELDAEVITNVKGYTASSATIVAQAGDKRQMSENSLYLIHRAWGYFGGNVNTLLKRMEELEKTDKRISNIYSKRSGKDESIFVDLMDENDGDGIWLDANEALEYGLIDEITEANTTMAMASTEDFKNIGLPIPKDVKEQPSKNTLEMTIDLDIKGLNELKEALNENDEEQDSDENHVSRERELLLLEYQN